MPNIRQIIRNAFKKKDPEPEPFQVDTSLYNLVTSTYNQQLNEVKNFATHLYNLSRALQKEEDGKEDELDYDVVGRDYEKDNPQIGFIMQLERFCSFLERDMTNRHNRVKEFSNQINNDNNGRSKLLRQAVHYFLKKEYLEEFNRIKDTYAQVVEKYDLKKFVDQVKLNEVHKIIKESFVIKEENNIYTLVHHVYREQYDRLQNLVSETISLEIDLPSDLRDVLYEEFLGFRTDAAKLNTRMHSEYQQLSNEHSSEIIKKRAIKFFLKKEYLNEYNRIKEEFYTIIKNYKLEGIYKLSKRFSLDESLNESTNRSLEQLAKDIADSYRRKIAQIQRHIIWVFNNKKSDDGYGINSIVSEIAPFHYKLLQFENHIIDTSDSIANKTLNKSDIIRFITQSDLKAELGNLIEEFNEILRENSYKEFKEELNENENVGDDKLKYIDLKTVKLLFPTIEKKYVEADKEVNNIADILFRKKNSMSSSDYDRVCKEIENLHGFFYRSFITIKYYGDGSENVSAEKITKLVYFFCKKKYVSLLEKLRYNVENEIQKSMSSDSNVISESEIKGMTRSMINFLYPKIKENYLDGRNKLYNMQRAFWTPIKSFHSRAIQKQNALHQHELNEAISNMDTEIIFIEQVYKHSSDSEMEQNRDFRKSVFFFLKKEYEPTIEKFKKIINSLSF